MFETQNQSTVSIDLIKDESARFAALAREVEKVIVGQEEAILYILLALLCRGHVLLEGVPGVAKTTLAKAFACAMGLSCARVQFTPDLLPADLVGTLIFDPKTQEFQTRKGPVFAQLVLADEINRAPAKVQSALLEAMQERQVTIGLQTYPLPEPFLVFATQNPIEQEGTYRLPEAQVDRFMFKVLVGYPSKEHERELLERSLDLKVINQVMSVADIMLGGQLVNNVYMDKKIGDYIVSIVHATRAPREYGIEKAASLISCGASPRATLALAHAAKAYAFIKRRHFVIPDDVKAVACAILRHRVMLSYDAQIQGISQDQIIRMILMGIPTP